MYSGSKRYGGLANHFGLAHDHCSLASPFHMVTNSNKYREGYDRIFGPKKKKLPFEAPTSVQMLVSASAKMLDRHYTNWTDDIDLDKLLSEDESVFQQLWPSKDQWSVFCSATRIDVKKMMAGMEATSEEDEYLFGITWFYEILDRRLHYDWREKFTEHYGKVSSETEGQQLSD